MLTLLLILGVLALLGLAGWSWLKAGAKPAPKRVSHKRPAYSRSTCPYCGEEGIVVRQDGEPHGRFHPCKASELERGLRLATVESNASGTILFSSADHIGMISEVPDEEPAA